MERDSLERLLVAVIREVTTVPRDVADLVRVDREDRELVEVESGGNRAAESVYGGSFFDAFDVLEVFYQIE